MSKINQEFVTKEQILEEFKFSFSILRDRMTEELQSLSLIPDAIKAITCLMSDLEALDKETNQEPCCFESYSQYKPGLEDALLCIGRMVEMLHGRISDNLNKFEKSMLEKLSEGKTALKVVLKE